MFPREKFPPDYFCKSDSPQSFLDATCHPVNDNFNQLFWARNGLKPPGLEMLRKVLNSCADWVLAEFSLPFFELRFDI